MFVGVEKCIMLDDFRHLFHMLDDWYIKEVEGLGVMKYSVCHGVGDLW